MMAARSRAHGLNPHGEVRARSLTAEEWQERISADTSILIELEACDDRPKGWSLFLSESLILAQDKRWRRA